ncbi:hypothetical protein AB5J55_43310 [Streptomyces sp. R11]|uniref:Regulatory protein n=1 Tax=Streptomyces sp. R11 TaxID=3238625 RepID=A0AB39NBT4_9ACTN
MPESTAPATELTSQYTSQVASDMERNVKEQDRIAAEIATLQQQLTALQHDHTVLVHMQQALGIAAAPEPTNSASAVPSPRKKTTSKPHNKAKTAVTQKTAAAKPTGKKAAAHTAQPTLVELIRRHLTEQSEPRSAAEIATVLSHAHPDRGIKATVVRTTLENLVAKNQAHRAKQGASVFYTAPAAPQPAAAPAQTQPAATK